MLLKSLLVIIGGGIGAFARYGVSLLADRLCSTNFPVATLVVNLTGCFLVGLSFSLVEQKLVSPNMRLLVVTGFLGAFTTFSAYALESIIAGKSGLHGMAFANIAINNVAGFVLVVAGMWIGRLP
jgi:CrcB protein